MGMRALPESLPRPSRALIETLDYHYVQESILNSIVQITNAQPKATMLHLQEQNHQYP